ncbi:MAG: SoxR reducing system RseC family protein [Oscillospiraceae bacterium]|nr:SoxR reducing system RseC family protein [Oscillospiraceae bacterium]
MTQTAIVVKSVVPGLCMVRVCRQSACARGCSGCPAECVSRHEPVEALARNPVKAKPGDRVTIESKTGSTLALAALLYLVPIALFFIGWIFHPLGGGFGVLLGLGLCMFVNRRLQESGGVQVCIISILSDEGTNSAQ